MPETIWFEVALVSILYTLGHIFLGHFEAKTPKLRKFVKYIMTIVVVLCLSVFVDRRLALILLGVSLLPTIYIHCILLPKKGINGWTGEPKEKYYAYRGWELPDEDR